MNVAEVGLGLAGEDPQQAGLAGAVEAEHEQPLAATEVEVDVLEDRSGRRSALHRPVRPDDRLAARGRVGEPDRHGLGRLRAPHPLGLEAGDALLDAVRHRRLRRLRAEAVDDGLQAVDLLRLEHRLLRESLLVLGPRPLVLAVGAAVLDDLADVGLGRPVEVQHPGDRLVEQFEVVADHEQGALVLAEEAEQPGLGVDVEVVGRLVEHSTSVPANRMRASSTRRRSPPDSVLIG